MSDESHSAAVRPRDVLLAAAWFGLLTGFAEVILRWAIQKQLFHDWLFYGPHLAWMAPLAEAILFALITGLFLLGARLARRSTLPRAALFVPVCLTFLTFALMLPGMHALAALLVAAGVAVHVSRFLAGRLARFLGLVRRSVGWGLAAVALLAVCVFGWRALTERRAVASLPPASPGAPNVLLLVLDTVRAQNLSAYGYARPTSPRIAALAEKGVRFEHAISTASWTTPSHFSMVTGRFPHELIGSRRNVMDATHPTLAEVLGARGYVSGGFVANVEYAGYETGFDRGFLHFEDYPASLAELALSSSVAEALVNDATLRNLTGEHQILGRKPADDVNRHFLDWLSKQDRGRPFFAFLNYFDAHEIYLPPHPWDDEFRSAAGRDVSGTQHFKRRVEIPHKKPVTPARIQSMLDAYDGSIAYLDHELGRLFDELELRGILDDTIVIVTSDHGEQFGEHGKFEHGNSLYRQLVEVPLVIRFPPRIPAGATVAEPVSLRDLAATALDLAGADRGGIGGRSLASLWSETSPRQAHQPLLSEWAGRSLTPPLPETHRSALWRATAFVRRKLGIQDSQRQGLRIRMKSLVADGYHYIRLGDGTEELYDFHSDPPEERDLARSGEASEQLARFRTSLQELLALGPDGVEASPEANLEPATRLTNQDVPR